MTRTRWKKQHWYNEHSQHTSISAAAQTVAEQQGISTGCLSSFSVNSSPVAAHRKLLLGVFRPVPDASCSDFSAPCCLEAVLEASGSVDGEGMVLGMFGRGDTMAAAAAAASEAAPARLLTALLTALVAVVAPLCGDGLKGDAASLCSLLSLSEPMFLCCTCRVEVVEKVLASAIPASLAAAAGIED